MKSKVNLKVKLEDWWDDLGTTEAQRSTTPLQYISKYMVKCTYMGGI